MIFSAGDALMRARGLVAGLLFAAVAACAHSGPSDGAARQANEVVFIAALRGDTAPTNTGSAATGEARIIVDRDAQTVDMVLDVSGISIDQLWDQVVQAPIGPIHFHFYSAQDHALDGQVELILPLPFGPSYAATANGFRVTMEDYPYADGAALLQSERSFDAFIDALDSGAVVLNIHTDAHNNGEISGAIVPAG